MTTESVLFISDEKYLTADIPGGVQLCTAEYMRYINAAGLNIIPFAIKHNSPFLKRIKIKLGFNVYNHYNIKLYANAIADKIIDNNIKLVFLNQVNLAPHVAEIQKRVQRNVKFIALSHGNESGDFLHDITKQRAPGFLQLWKLGKQQVLENCFFDNLLNGVIVMSEQEVGINQWLGAKNILYLPRILEPRFIEWQGQTGVVGFLGTLDHLPNKLGIEYLASSLKETGFAGSLRIVGGPEKVGKALADKFSFINYLGPITDSELHQEIKKWSVFLNPVFWYARGASTKLALAISYGLPLITTPAGCRGYELSDNGITCADNTPECFAQMLNNALKSPELLKRLKYSSEQNAKDFMIEKHIFNLKEFIQKILPAT